MFGAFSGQIGEFKLGKIPERKNFDISQLCIAHSRGTCCRAQQGDSGQKLRVASEQTRGRRRPDQVLRTKSWVTNERCGASPFVHPDLLATSVARSLLSRILMQTLLTAPTLISAPTTNNTHLTQWKKCSTTQKQSNTQKKLLTNFDLWLTFRQHVLEV